MTEIHESEPGLSAVPDPQPEVDYTGKRRVLRYKPEFDKDGLATVMVGDDPKIVHAGTGTSSTVCLWVEVDGSTEDVTPIKVASVPTGGVVPEGAEYLHFFFEPTPFGVAIRHLYRLP